jgi:hypothetical protein
MSVTRTASLLWKVDEKQFPIPRSDDIHEDEWDEDLFSYQPFTLQDITDHRVKFCPECKCCYVMGDTAIKWFSKAGSKCPNCDTSIEVEDLMDLPVPEWRRSYETWKSERLQPVSMPVQPPEQGSLPELDAALSNQITQHLRATVQTFFLYLKHDIILTQAVHALEHGTQLLTTSNNSIVPNSRQRQQLFYRNILLINQIAAELDNFTRAYKMVPMFTPDPWTRPVCVPQQPANTPIASLNRAKALYADFNTTGALFSQSVADNTISLEYICHLLDSGQLVLKVTSTVQPGTRILQSVTYEAWYHFNGDLYPFSGEVSA